MVLDREKGREGCRMEGGGWVFMDGHEKGGGRMHSDDLPHLGGISLTLRLRRKYTEQDACRYLFPWLAKQDLEESG